MNIRRATVADAEVLTKIARKSFFDTFADHPKNSPEDMKSYMDEAFTFEVISAELQERDTIYLVAEIENEIVAYAKLRQNSREEGIFGENPIELCRLYSLKEYIGKGVGKALMLKGLEFAKANHHDVMWLGVWEFNFNAQKFYTKFGFKKCGEHIFQLGQDPQTDWLMQRGV